MLKMIVINWRKPEISLEEFNHHWYVNHGALVKQHAKAMGFLRYVQSHKIPNAEIEAFAADRGWQEAPDGVTEVWWESLESMTTALSSPEGQEASAALEADEVNFVASKKLSAFLSEEKVIFDFTKS